MLYDINVIQIILKVNKKKVNLVKNLIQIYYKDKFIIIIILCDYYIYYLYIAINKKIYNSLIFVFILILTIYILNSSFKI